MRVVIALLCLVAAASAAADLRRVFQRGQAVDTYDNGLILPRFREAMMAAEKPNWDLVKDFTTAYQFATTGLISKRRGKMGSQQMQKNLHQQLSRDGRKVVFDDFLKFFVEVAKSDSKENMVLWDKALHGMLKLLYLASRDDPTYFVSHAGDHGIRVDLIWERHLRSLRYVIKALRKQFFNIDVSATVTDGTKQTVRREAKPDLVVDTDLYCRLLVGIAHILHDVGYSGLPEDITSPLKWTHAINGAELIKKTLADSLGKLIPAEHFTAIVDAVRYHNADATKCKTPDPHPSCAYPAEGPKNKKDHEAFFAKDGVGAVGKNQIAELMVRKYVAASLKPGQNDEFVKFNPLLWLLRFADNGDAARNRLTAGQRDVRVMTCWRDLALDCSLAGADNGSVKKGRNHGDDVKAFKDNGASCKLLKDGDAAAKELHTDFIAPTSINQMDFLHYYSNYVIERMYWSQLAKKTDEDFSGTLTVDYVTDLGDGLAISHMPGAAAYQISRFAEAAESLFFPSGKTVTELVTIEMKNFPKPGKTTTLPLSAFNKDTAKKTKVKQTCEDFNKNFATGQKCFAGGSVSAESASALDKGFTPIDLNDCPN